MKKDDASEDEVALEAVLGIVMHGAPFAHLFEILINTMKLLEGFEGEGAFEVVFQPWENVNPKYRLNPAYQFLVALPVWKEQQIKVQQELVRQGYKPRPYVPAAPVARPSPWAPRPGYVPR